ncbi:MAG: hypothetical protein JW896_06220 [Deltaproteobacteria bacterium]|nr:hypothetical protein [Deltaproteobacteria bacterium]
MRQAKLGSKAMTDGSRKTFVQKLHIDNEHNKETILCMLCANVPLYTQFDEEITEKSHFWMETN